MVALEQNKIDPLYVSPSPNKENVLYGGFLIQTKTKEDVAASLKKKTFICESEM